MTVDEPPFPSSLPLLPEPPRSFHGLGRAGVVALLAIGLVSGGGIGGFMMVSATPASSPARLAVPSTYAITLSTTTPRCARDGAAPDGAAPEGPLY